MKKCPYCAEEIQDEAIKCRYCLSDLTGPPPQAQGPYPGPQQPPTAPWQPPLRPPGQEPIRRWDPGPSSGTPWPYTPAAPRSPEAPAEPQAPPGLGGPPGPAGPATTEDAARAPGPAVSAPAAPGAPPSPAPRVGEGALRFSHSGRRYILGFGSDYFGIWDREQPGPPILRFSRTNEGWDEAWNRFTAWEPRSMEVPVQGVMPSVGAAAAPAGAYASTRTNAVLAMGLAGATAVAAAVTLVFCAQQLHLLQQLQVGRSVSLATGRAVDDRLKTSDGIFGLAAIAGLVFWLIWQFRAHRNLRALGSSGMRFTPGWAVGWWFIPFANIVMPYRAMSELWKASEPKAGAVEWKSALTPVIFWFWWGALIGGGILGAAARSVVAAKPVPIHSFIIRDWLLVAEFGLVALYALLAIFIIRGIESRQEQKRRRSEAWSGSFVPA